MSKLSNI